MTSSGGGGGLVRCPACGNECFVLRKPRYEGFTKVGEDRVCAGCGHTLDQETEAERPAAPQVFSDADRPTVPDVFREDARGRLCRYCRHYVVNPFRQWCAEHEREVEATETCERFTPRDPET